MAMGPGYFPPLVLTPACPKHSDPVFPHFWAFFGRFYHRYCGSNAIENVVCSSVQAAGICQYGCQSVGVIPCALVVWGVCWPVGRFFAVMKG